MKFTTISVSYVSPHFKGVTPLPGLQNTKDRNWQSSAACNAIIRLMFTKLTNKISKINYALYGVKLNAQSFIVSHTNDTLLKTMPHINQALLQFIDVMKLVDLLLHFSPCVSAMTQVISGTYVSVWAFV